MTGCGTAEQPHREKQLHRGGRVRNTEGQIGQTKPSNISDFLVPFQTFWPSETARCELFNESSDYIMQ
jgi:hypothetical protein